jgi:hypothetical protein
VSDILETAAPAPAADSGEAKTYANEYEAVAELERRESERRAQRKAERAERDERIAQQREKAAEAEREIEADAKREREEADEEDDEPRRRKADDKADKADKDKPRRKADKAESDEADGEEAEEDSEGDGDDVPAADEDDADDSDEDEAEDDKSLRKPEKLKVGDTEVEIPKGTPKAAVEAIKSLQHRLTADYTRKTQEAAETRKAAAERTEAADSLLQQVQRAQQAVVSMAQRLIGNPPPLELAQSDPAGYLYAKEAYEARVRDLQALNAHTGELTRSQQQQRQQAQQQALLEEAQRTVKVLPQLADTAKRTAFLEAAVQAASASGFTPDDVASVTDHRMLHLLDRLVKAERRLSALDGASKSVKSKLADVAPKPLRAGNAGTQSQGQMNKASRAREMFMKSGRSMKDVQRYLEALDS